MTRKEFLKSMWPPLSGVLKKYPNGIVMQYWAESPDLYSGVYGRTDEVGRFTAGHTGVDLKTSFRDPIRAPFSGTIVGLVEDRASTGGLQVYLESPELQDGDKTVVIQTGFAHLDEITVKVGQQVERGAVIGYEGNTGFVVSGSTPYWGNAPAGKGVHLHWTMREFLITPSGRKHRYENPLGNTVDPLYYLSGDTSGNLVYANNIANLIRYLLAKAKVGLK